MDRKAVGRIVGREAPKLVKLLWLGHWAIDFVFDPCTDCDAYCERNHRYRTATVAIDPAKHKDEGAVIDSLEHELLHLVLAPFDDYRCFSLPSYVEGSAEAKREESAWELAVEQCLGNVHRAMKEMRKLAKPGK